MINSLTDVAKVFSNTLIFLLQKSECNSLFVFRKKEKKINNVFAIFQDRYFNVTLANIVTLQSMKLPL